jgi:Domain of unknown function (DUF4267)
MDAARTLAVALAVNRTAFGMNYLLRPEQARTSWVGRAAGKPGAQVMIRSQGVRDVTLGLGALRTVARGDPRELRAWMTGHAACDLTDLVVTWAARDRLPSRQARLAMSVAAASAAIALTAVARIGSVRDQT